MNALIWLGNGAWIAGIAVEAGKSRSCAEQNAQAEAGPLMLMVRRANMGASIAGGGGNRKGRRRWVGPVHLRWGRAGLPVTVWPSPTSRVTTLPAPITAPSPTVTPGRM